MKKPETLSGSQAGTAIRRPTEVFAELYEQFMPKVFKYINYRIGEIAVAEDITSTVFEKALTRFESYSADKAAFSTWIFTITRNTLIDYYRMSSKRQTVPIEDISQSDDDPDTADDNLIRKEELSHLKSCLGRLSQHEQEIISVKFGAEMNNRQIAKMLSLSESNVGTIIYRAVKKLRDCFAGWQNGR